MSVSRNVTTPVGSSAAPARRRSGSAPAPRLGRGLRPRLGRQRQRRILREHRALELAQPLARLDAELLDERAPRVLVGLQRVGLAVGAVEREHQLGAQPLAVRVLGDQRLELRRPPRRGGRARASPRPAARARRRAGPRGARSRAGRTARRRGRRAAGRARARAPRSSAASAALGSPGGQLARGPRRAGARSAARRSARARARSS